MGGVMSQIDTAQFPYELIDVQSGSQVAKLDCPPDKLHQSTAPCSFHLEYLVPDPALDVVELEEPGRYRTSAGQPGSLRPSKPIPNQRAQSRETLGRSQRRPRHVFADELCHVIQQLDLDIFFRAEVREQSALRHPDLARQNPEGNAAQP